MDNQPAINTPTDNHMNRAMVPVTPLHQKPIVQPLVATPCIEVSKLNV